MELQTEVRAEAGKQEINVRREFNLPVDLLFKAYIKPEFIEQWMGNKVLAFEPNTNGHFVFESRDAKGNRHGFRGVFHELNKNQKIIRTFEMVGMPFGVQLEILDFKPLDDTRSRLQKKIIFESVQQRDENLKLPFRQGLNRAHDRLQEIMLNVRT